MNTFVQIKCYLNYENKKHQSKPNEIRRFDLCTVEKQESHAESIIVKSNSPVNYSTSNSLFKNLIEQIKNSYGSLIDDNAVNELKTYWLDDENELVGFSNDEQLEYAINFYRTKFADNETAKPLIKLYIFQQELNNIQSYSFKQNNSQFKCYVCSYNNSNVCSSCKINTIDRKQSAEAVVQNSILSETTSPEATVPLGNPNCKPKKFQNIQQFGKYAKKVLSPLKEMNKDINNFYNQNFHKTNYPEYKLSDLKKSSKQEASLESNWNEDNLRDDSNSPSNQTQTNKKATNESPIPMIDESIGKFEAILETNENENEVLNTEQQDKIELENSNSSAILNSNEEKQETKDSQQQQHSDIEISLTTKNIN
jgi:hypothetical protein